MGPVAPWRSVPAPDAPRTGPAAQASRHTCEVFPGIFRRTPSVAANLAHTNGFPKSEKNEELIKRLNDFYESLPKLAYTGHTGQIDNVLRAIETGSDVLSSGEDGRHTIEIITAIYKAGCEQKTVELPIQADDPFYTARGIMERAPRFYQKLNYLKDQGDYISADSGKK